MSRRSVFHLNTGSHLALARAVEDRIDRLEARRAVMLKQKHTFTDGDELADLYAIRIDLCTACDGYGCESCRRPS